jgi:hypothetical protein
VGFRPLDKNRFTEFTRYEWEEENGWRGEFNLNLRTGFFEGDLGSVFPIFDYAGRWPIDLGFSVGRQNINFQDGVMINDDLDVLALVRNNLRFPFIPASNIRVSGLWGWDGSDRGPGNNPINRGEPQAHVLGLFSSLDMHHSTVNIDSIYVIDDKSSGGDASYFGVSSIQRIPFEPLAYINSTFRLNSSFGHEVTNAAVGKGILLTSELSFTPHHSDDNVYFNSFWAAGNYTQAGREPILGGPIAPLGILFASPNLGDFRSELIGAAQDALGVVLGYQAFWNYHFTNLTLEMAGTKDTGGGVDQYGLGFQFQHKLSQHVQFQIDGHFGVVEDENPRWGGRSEFLIII